MNWFYNLKISAKLVSGFIAVAMIACIVGVIGIYNLLSISNSYNSNYENNSKPEGNLSKASVDFQRSRINTRNILIDKDSNNRKEYLDKIDSYIHEMDKNLKEFSKALTSYSDTERKEYDSLLSLLDQLKPLREKTVNFAMQNQDKQAMDALLNEADPVAREIDTTLSKLIEDNISEGEKISKDNLATANKTVIIMMVIIIVAVIISVILGLFISGTISKPITKVVDAANKLAVGDINVNVSVDRKDEIGNLVHSFSKMVENIREQAFAVEKIAEGDLTATVKVKSDDDLLGKKLQEMIETNNEILANINTASDQVAAGAKQVSNSSQILSQGSTEQASSIEEITASMTQVATQSKQNAGNANQANNLALTAKEDAINGNIKMQEMVSAMAEINESSSSISKIIKVIEEIAFQTNILALNAAVEAARAGHHGKGFAVVAEEVRNLAARSANAAKETTEMIENSIKKVESGTQIANSTAEALNRIVDGVAKAADLVGDIASASSEQASGIAQINLAISQVAQVVQVNSATAEESAAASEELSSQAEIMKSAVSRFRLRKVAGGLSFESGMSPDLIRMIENIVDKKGTYKHPEQKNNFSEATAFEHPSKAKISLDENNYGKY